MRQGTIKMKLAQISAWGTGAAVLALLAAASVTRKANTLAKPGDTRPNATTQPVGADEWAKVGQWLKDNQCDQRYQFIDDRLPAGRRQMAKELLIRRVHLIQMIRDPDRKEAVIHELQAEDQIFSAQIAYRIKPSTEAAEDVKQAVAHLLEAQLAEKTVQLKRLQTELIRVQTEIKDLKDKKQPDRLEQIAHGYLNQAQIRPRVLHPPGEVGAEGETESHNAEVKH